MNLVLIDTFIDVAKRNYAFGNELSKKGYNIIYLTYSKESERFLKSKKLKCIYLIDEFKKHQIQKRRQEYLKHFEQKYNTLSPNLLISFDIDYKRLGQKKAEIGLIKHFLFWEDFLKNNQVDYIIGGIERFVSVVPYYVSKKFNVTYFNFQISPLINEHFLLNKDIFGQIDELNEKWEKSKNKKLTEEEIKKTKEYIDSIVIEKKGSYIGINRKLGLDFSNISYFIRRIYLNIFVEKFNNPYAQLFAIGKKEFAKILRKNIERFYYYEPKQNDKYFYFPLHIDNDAQLIVRTPHYTNQFTLIEYISKCMPAGYKLYVKSHPNNIGGTYLRVLKNLKKLPNVKLIKPTTNSHDIINNASGIICISSTVGLEGLLHKKQVITLGDPFYARSNLTWEVKDLYKLPETIKLVLTSNKIQEETLIRFMNTYLKTPKEGYILVYKGVIENFLKKGNFEKVANSIIERINENESSRNNTGKGRI
nr:hypothetical protein [Nanoarchaeum sp.]